MKKLIALLLTVVMVMSIMLPVVATETNDTVAPEAPVVRSVQLQEVKDGNDQITAYNIRFLSTVSSLSGSKLGYEVSAQFEGTNGITRQVYSAANGDTNMEGSTVYSKIYVYDGGEKTSVDAAQLAALKLREGEDASTAKGIFAVAITGVPTNVDVIFTVKSYVIYNGEKIESTVVATKYADGDCVNITEDVKYQENFNDAEGLNATLSRAPSSTGFGALSLDPFVKVDYASSYESTVGDFQSAISGLNWELTSFPKDTNCSTETLNVNNGAVSLSGISTVQAAAPTTMRVYKVYSIDMDLQLNDQATLDIFFNNTGDVGNYSGSGEYLTLSQNGDELALALTAYAGDNSKNMSHKLVIASKNVTANDAETFHLTLLVNNNTKTVQVLINGDEVLSSNALIFTQGGGLEFKYNTAGAVIDNIVMLGQEKHTTSNKYDEDKALYELDFTDTTAAKADFAGVLDAGGRYDDYVNFSENTMTINNTKYYMFELVAEEDDGTTVRDRLQQQDKYYISMNITTNAAATNGGFQILFNTDSTSEFASAAYVSLNFSQVPGAFGTYSMLELDNANLKLWSATNGTRPANENGNREDTITGIRDNVLTESIADYTDSNTFELVMEVDNTGATTTVNIYINDTHVATVEGLYNNDGSIYFVPYATTTINAFGVYGGTCYTPAA